MKIVFVGTGGGYPSPSAPEYRGDTTTLIDNILIDAPHTAEAGLTKAGIGLSAVRNLLITHPHGDHFNAETIRKLASTGKLRNIAAVKSLRPMIREMLSGMEGVKLPRILALQPGKPVEFDGLWVLPVMANHRNISDVHDPLNFLVEKDGKRFLYFLDTALPLNVSVETLKAAKKPADLLIIECTCYMSDVHQWMFVHLSVPAVSRIAQAWRQSGILKETAPVYGSHLVNGQIPYPPPDDEAAKFGVKLARDGLAVEI